MSAAGASTSQQTESKDRWPHSDYEICFLWLQDDVYEFAITEENSCIHPPSVQNVYGPTFKEEGGVSMRMAENCEHRPEILVCVKICNIDKDQLDNFRSAILSCHPESASFALQGNKNFMLQAWTYAWQQEALNKVQYDTGMKIFGQCTGGPKEVQQVRQLARDLGGMWYWIGEDDRPSKEAPPMYLHGKRVRKYDPDNKEAILYYGR